MKELSYVFLTLFMLLQVLGYQCQKERIQNLEIEIKDYKKTQALQEAHVRDLEHQTSELYEEMVKLQNKVDDLPK